MTSHQYSDSERKAIYRVIHERRDIRHFVEGPIPDAALFRLLRAAAKAPSVGYMQPWNFIVIRSLETRRKIYDAFLTANKEAVELFEPERAKLYKSLKLEGILSSTLNLCITCDRNRAGTHVLGRTCQPDVDLFSAVCAAQNLWLVARAEGIAVGWVSILKKEDLIQILGLPLHVVPIAYLCIGHTKEFPEEPELKTRGWADPLCFEDLVFDDQWGKKYPQPDLFMPKTCCSDARSLPLSPRSRDEN